MTPGKDGGLSYIPCREFCVLKVRIELARKISICPRRCPKRELHRHVVAWVVRYSDASVKAFVVENGSFVDIELDIVAGRIEENRDDDVISTICREAGDAIREFVVRRY